MRKGFYFSMDAVLALTIMSASMFLTLQASDSASKEFDTQTLQYQQVTTEARDVMKVSSTQKYSSIKKDIRENISLKKEAENKSVIYAITVLWSDWNRTDAKELTKKYFSGKLQGDYEFAVEISESGETTRIYETSPIKGSPKIVTSTSQLVSGHVANQSQSSGEPYQWGPADFKLVVWK